ncbi:hypothetical protein JTB14_022979 [Gonioctena quinquepunctata]|nr:hypothetical protein JTB14_022979 [Gonioctena quinquepunctata]
MKILLVAIVLLTLVSGEEVRNVFGTSARTVIFQLQKCKNWRVADFRNECMQQLNLVPEAVYDKEEWEDLMARYLHLSGAGHHRRKWEI